MALLRPKAGRVLEPYDRLSEVLFGLIMVMTFTGSLSVADAGRDDVRAMLIGALGCNTAWGVIDGILFLMGTDADRSRGLKTVQAVRAAADPAHGQRLIAEAAPPVLAGTLQPADLETMRQRLLALPEPPQALSLNLDDFRGAFGVFLLVFGSTFPLTIPFMLMHKVEPAMRVSNGIAMIMLFFVGYAFGQITGRRPALTGGAMVLLGGVLVAMTIALGG